MRELAKIFSSKLEMMALFSTVFEYFMCDLILYDVLYLVVHTHNFFHWLPFENGKLLNVGVFRISLTCRFHSGCDSLWQARPSVAPR